jgi:hypothetical protein
MASEDQKGKKTLLLKPEEASFSDLFGFLVSGDIQSKEFIECLKEKETSLKRRGIILISVIVQKALQAAATPLQLCGSVVEFWLNLLANNEVLSVLRG